jgi:dipeptidase D
MTVNEEVGGPDEGASGLDPELLTGTILFNLDSEEDGKLTIGSASSTGTLLRVEKPRAVSDPDASTLSVSVYGGLGGHSGADIARGRANVIKVLAGVLREACSVVPFRLASLEGGSSWNAIPREARATCSIPAADEAAFRKAVESAGARFAGAFARTDPGLVVDVSDTRAPDAWTEAATVGLLDLLAIVPSGPLAMSPEFQGLVETSTSLGQAFTRGAELMLRNLSRSSNDQAVPALIGTLEAAARLAGAVLEVEQTDPGWRADLGSAALASTMRVYERLFGDAPTVTAAHVWLETAVIGERVPGLDMVSFGPQIEAPHSPDERVDIHTVERFWRLLVGIVDELSA